MYTWEGMEKINHEKAIELFNNDKGIFLLYEDDTEGVCEDLENLHRHYESGGELGIEK